MEEESIWDDFFTDLGLDREPKEIHSFCSQCNTHQGEFITTNGDILCPGCGLVQEERIISDDPEWNNYVEEGVMNSSGMRCGTGLRRRPCP